MSHRCRGGNGALPFCSFTIRGAPEWPLIQIEGKFPVTSPSNDTHINPAEETIRLGPLVVRFLVTGGQSNGSVAIFELTVPAGQKLPVPAHSHDHYEESIYGLTGVMTWTVDGQSIDLRSGQALCIPRGAVHRFDNNGIEEAKSLCMISPAHLGPDYFREVAEVSKATGGGPPDRAKMAEIMRRYGLTMIAPSPQA